MSPPLLPDITAAELAGLVRGVILPRYWPPYLQTAEAIAGHIRATVQRLRRCPLLEVEADFDSYGSGYASYVHLFCAKAGSRVSTARLEGITLGP